MTIWPSILNNYKMDPTLYSNCSPAIKYFCSPEPVVQEPYKKKLSLEQSPGAILSMDVKPYNQLPTPYDTPAK